jgi:hypothetical protein
VPLKYVKFQNVRRYATFDDLLLFIYLKKKKKILVKVNNWSILIIWISLTIFIEDNQSDAEITKVQKIALFGTT